MSRFLSKKLESIVPYKVTLNSAWESTNEDVLKLDWNESARMLYEELEVQYPDLNLNWYPKLLNRELLSALADYCGLSKESSLYYAASSDLVHENILKVFINPGDKVLMLTPTYDNFRFSVEVYGGLVSKLDWKYVGNIQEELLKNQFRICYICSPNNPTGQYLFENSLRTLLVSNASTLFIIDEAYIEFSESASMITLTRDFDNIIITRTLSKAFGLAGIRFGYCIAESTLIEDIWGYNNPKLVSMFTQSLALKALSDIDRMTESVESIKLNRQLLADYLEKNGFQINCLMSGNFILFKDTCESLLENNLNALVSQGIFLRSLNHINGLERNFRITVPAFNDIDNLIQRFKTVFGR